MRRFIHANHPNFGSSTVNVKQALIKAACLAVALGSSAAMAQTVVGGGASLPEYLYQSEKTDFPADYSYAVTGSGVGKTSLLTNSPTAFNQAFTPNRTDTVVHFAGSDSVLSDSEINTFNTNRSASEGGLIQMPSVGTAVGIPFKVSGVSSLTLTTNQLCSIFSGKFKKWNEVNVGYPATDINVAFRSDSSGTTEIFTRHLASVCSVASGNSQITFPVTTRYSDVVALMPAADQARFQGANLSAGVRDAVDAGTSVIGYLSPDYINTTLAPSSAVATKNLTAAFLRNKNSSTNYQPTAANTTLALNSLALGTDLSKPQSWAPTAADPASGYPISGLTFLDHVQCYSNATVQSKILAFLGRHYTYSGVNDNTNRIEGNGFAKLPTAIVDSIRKKLLDNVDGMNLNIGNATACSGKAGR